MNLKKGSSDERSKTQINAHHTTPFTGSIQNRKTQRQGVDEELPGAWGGGKEGGNGKVHPWFPGDKNVPKLIVVIIQHCDSTKDC